MIGRYFAILVVISSSIRYSPLGLLFPNNNNTLIVIIIV